MKTQIKEWGNSNILVLSSDFMKFHNAKVGDWIDLSESMILETPKQKQIRNLKDKFPETYKSHIKQFPEDKI